MKQELKIKDLYREIVSELKSKEISTPELDARVIICYALKMTDADFFKTDNDLISNYQADKIIKLVRERVKNIPVAYILGQKEFYGLNFYVNKNVLIPRPESEWLVEEAVKYIKTQKRKIAILDLGTGSGNIIISIYKSLMIGNWQFGVKFHASDISSKALFIAKKNAKKYKLDKKIKLFHSDLFSNWRLQKKFDLIVANLPYVPKNNEPLTVYRSPISFEPQNAIFASDNGAEIIKKFLVQAKNYLNNNGLILIELDPRNAADLKEFTQSNFPNTKIQLEKDLAGFERYLIIRI